MTTTPANAPGSRCGPRTSSNNGSLNGPTLRRNSAFADGPAAIPVGHGSGRDTLRRGTVGRGASDLAPPRQLACRLGLRR